MFERITVGWPDRLLLLTQKALVREYSVSASGTMILFRDRRAYEYRLSWGFWLPSYLGGDCFRRHGRFVRKGLSQVFSHAKSLASFAPLKIPRAAAIGPTQTHQLYLILTYRSELVNENMFSILVCLSWVHLCFPFLAHR